MVRLGFVHQSVCDVNVAEAVSRLEYHGDLYIHTKAKRMTATRFSATVFSFSHAWLLPRISYESHANFTAPLRQPRGKEDGDRATVMPRSQDNNLGDTIVSCTDKLHY